MLSPAEWIVLSVTLGLISALMGLNAWTKRQSGRAVPEVKASEFETGEASE